jgi:SAM-dependent methyltransferase
MGKEVLNPTQRFTDRVGNYVLYRPSYPEALIDHLAETCRIGNGTCIADIGSGTGIFTKLLLGTGATVHAVEPNAAMREAAEGILGSLAGFRSVAGTAESTGLGDHSVSLVTCAQAFHWFDPLAASLEFRRILSPAGSCALVWNTMNPTGSAFAVGYEAIKARFGTDFGRVRHENLKATTVFEDFFGNREWRRVVFENSQVLDFPGLKGRLLSSSYAPKENDPRHEPMLDALKELFGRCEQQGQVRMEYETELYLGHIS